MLNASIDAGFDETCNDHEYYFDDTNDQSWTCTFGTEEGVCRFVKISFFTAFGSAFPLRANCLSLRRRERQDGIWLVRNDPPGTLMSFIGVLPQMFLLFCSYCALLPIQPCLLSFVA
jgi:hypothetical protein